MKKKRGWRKILRNDYDFDFGYLLAIEKYKLSRMQRYFETSNVAEDDLFVANRIKLMIKVLNIYHKFNGGQYINIRNCKRFGFSKDRFAAESSEWVKIMKTSLYQEKAWHLYSIIREYNLRTFWN